MPAVVFRFSCFFAKEKGRDRHIGNTLTSVSLSGGKRTEKKKEKISYNFIQRFNFEMGKKSFSFYFPHSFRSRANRFQLKEFSLGCAVRQAARAATTQILVIFSLHFCRSQACRAACLNEMKIFAVLKVFSPFTTQ